MSGPATLERMAKGNRLRADDRADDRRCTAMSKRTRERCGRYRAPDMAVCHSHGGTRVPLAVRLERLERDAVALLALDEPLGLVDAAAQDLSQKRKHAAAAARGQTPMATAPAAPAPRPKPVYDTPRKPRMPTVPRGFIGPGSDLL